MSIRAKTNLLECVLIGLVALLLATLFLAVPSISFPSEDAAMLYQYSENLAETGRISYITNGERAEGATDFLWMLVLAACAKVGLSVYLCATVISAAALLYSAHMLRRLTGQKSRLPLLISAIFLLGTPQVFAAVQGFSPLVFGALVLSCLLAYHEQRTRALMLSAIGTCLVRPDGVVFAIPIVLLYLLQDRSAIRERLLGALLYAGLPGGIYFVWRYLYFGELLPLPFYVKSNFDRFLGIFSLDALLLNLTFMLVLAPLWGPALWVFRKSPAPVSKRALYGVGVLLLLPFLFYSCMQLEQNLAYRFQYPFVIISAGAAAIGFRHHRKTGLTLGGAVLPILLMLPWTAVECVRTLSMPSENIPYLSERMRTLNCKGTIAATEAGRLPYYSGWPTTDLWGLNTPALARTLVTAKDIEDTLPDLIVLHPEGDDYSFLNGDIDTAHTERSWQHMIENVYSACRRLDYELLMVPHMATDRLSGPATWMPRLRASIETRVGYEGGDAVYYAFFIDPKSPCHDELQTLILEHGGISLDAYGAR